MEIVENLEILKSKILKFWDRENLQTTEIAKSNGN